MTSIASSTALNKDFRSLACEMAVKASKESKRARKEQLITELGLEWFESLTSFIDLPETIELIWKQIEATSYLVSKVVELDFEGEKFKNQVSCDMSSCLLWEKKGRDEKLIKSLKKQLGETRTNAEEGRKTCEVWKEKINWWKGCLAKNLSAMTESHAKLNYFNEISLEKMMDLCEKGTQKWRLNFRMDSDPWTEYGDNTIGNEGIMLEYSKRMKVDFDTREQVIKLMFGNA